MSNKETKTIQLKITSPNQQKFIDTLVKKITEEGWTYNYDRVFKEPNRVFLTKEVYIDSEEPDLTSVTAEYYKKKVIATDKVAPVYDICNKQITPLSYDPDKVDVLITGEEGSPTYKLLDENTGEVELVLKDTPESILPVLNEPTSDLVEEEVPTALPEPIEPVAAENELQEKIGDGNVYTLEQLKDIQWHKLTKVGSAYGLHAMKRGDMEAAIVELSQGNKVDE
jgi:hypothetical protein